MAVKSVTVTEDAYKALRGMKYPTESFSEAILRISTSKRGLPRNFFGIWKNTDVTDIKKRRKEIESEATLRHNKIEQALS